KSTSIVNREVSGLSYKHYNIEFCSPGERSLPPSSLRCVAQVRLTHSQQLGLSRHGSTAHQVFHFSLRTETDPAESVKKKLP
ncbi:mCG142785, partial [Mus musculus]